MSWILVTGGVCSGIGKGCVAAMVARISARAGLHTAYQKLEPCLQGDIEALPNTCFGEIVRAPSGACFDGDVARAAFYVPGFTPAEGSDLSLGRLMASLLERTRGAASPRFQDLDRMLEPLAPRTALTVVEVGGTAGEMEHRILCEALWRALGRPALHVHLTAIVLEPGGRRTTKPAQLSLESLRIPADLVLVRGAGADDEALAPLRTAAGAEVPVVRLPEDGDWPERAAMQALCSRPAAELFHRRLGFVAGADHLFEAAPPGEQTLEVAIVHDGAGADGYASLAHRLRAWSRGCLRLRWQTRPDLPPDVRGVIRVGERPPASLQHPEPVPMLQIAPEEQGRRCRDPEARPDWSGTADAPEGAVADFVRAVISAMPSASGEAPSAYADDGFASVYLAADERGELRDHGALDDLVARALPAGERLKRARILDVGCGAGRWAARLVAAGAREVVGVEPAPPMARAAAARGLDRFELHACPVEHYEPTGLFDAVLASMSLDHVEDLAPVLQRLAEHLVPHGRLIVTTEHPLRTSPLNGVRWVQEANGTRAARVRDYGREGFRAFRWFRHPAVVRVYHRPMAAWFQLLREAGLDLVAIGEPVSSEPRDAGNPRFWLLVAERPSPRRALVTVDGGAASGKTTLGERLARHLGWTLVDTGRLQRALAWRALAGTPSALVEARLAGDRTRYIVGGHDVTEQLDNEVVTEACSKVACDGTAQEELAAMIEEMTRAGCIVTGRAMGRLHADALARFYLTAPVEVRAARRGCRPVDIEERDRRDIASGRLLPPDIDTILLNTASQEPDALADHALTLIRLRLAGAGP